MSSIAQIEANRSNAQKSTGPRTPEGVAACCRNATRHGLFSSQPLAPGESAEEFAEHRRAVLADLAPQGAVEELLADRAVQQAWRLRRVTRMAAQLEDRGIDFQTGQTQAVEPGIRGLTTQLPQLSSLSPNSDSLMDELRRLDLLRRYERSIEQGFLHALRELSTRQKARREEARRARQEEDRRAGREAAAVRQKEADERRRLREAEESERRLLRQAREEAQYKRRESVREVESWIAQEEATARALERQSRMDEALAEAAADAA